MLLVPTSSADQDFLSDEFTGSWTDETRYLL